MQQIVYHADKSYFLTGLVLAWAIYAPTYSSWKLQGSIRDEPTFLWSSAGVWAVSYRALFKIIFLAPVRLMQICPLISIHLQLAELLNFHSHITLRNLRPPGTRTRAIPKGFGFNLVSCPNYFWEIIGWTVIAVMTNSFAGGFYAP